MTMSQADAAVEVNDTSFLNLLRIILGGHLSLRGATGRDMHRDASSEMLKIRSQPDEIELMVPERMKQRLESIQYRIVHDSVSGAKVKTNQVQLVSTSNLAQHQPHSVVVVDWLENGSLSLKHVDSQQIYIVDDPGESNCAVWKAEGVEGSEENTETLSRGKLIAGRDLFKFRLFGGNTLAES